jgi:hypothetical protein
MKISKNGRKNFVFYRGKESKKEEIILLIELFEDHYKFIGEVMDLCLFPNEFTPIVINY